MSARLSHSNGGQVQGRQPRSRPTWDDTIHDLHALYQIPSHLRQCRKEAKATKFQTFQDDEKDGTKSSRSSLAQIPDKRTVKPSVKGLERKSKHHETPPPSVGQLLDSMQSCSAKIDYSIECISHRADDDRLFRTQVLGDFETLRMQNEENSRLLEQFMETSSDIQSKLSGELGSLRSEIALLTQQMLKLSEERTRLVRQDSVIDPLSSSSPDRAGPGLNAHHEPVAAFQARKSSVHNIHIPSARETVLPIRYELITDENSVQPIRRRVYHQKTDRIM